MEIDLKSDKSDHINFGSTKLIVIIAAKVLGNLPQYHSSGVYAFCSCHFLSCQFDFDPYFNTLSKFGDHHPALIYKVSKE
jgi:hypothetical protein